MTTILETKKFKEVLKGFTVFSDNLVEVIGEQKVQLENGEIIEQYVYNIEGYVPSNGLPFVSVKGNILLF